MAHLAWLMNLVTINCFWCSGTGSILFVFFCNKICTTGLYLFLFLSMRRCFFEIRVTDVIPFAAQGGLGKGMEGNGNREYGLRK